MVPGQIQTRPPGLKKKKKEKGLLCTEYSVESLAAATTASATECGSAEAPPGALRLSRFHR